VLHLRSIELKPAAQELGAFPFNLPVIKTFPPLQFTTPVTFLVGENGSGKSTFLEAVAAGVGSPAIGDESVARDGTLVHARRLAEQMRFAWTKKTRRGFFLRAEDFFNFTKRLRAMGKELDDLAADCDQRFTGYGRLLATGSIEAQKSSLTNRYGADLDANSHGESFLKLFAARFVAGGLYLLDEPEAPLSPQRQLAFLMMLKEMVAKDAQFIIATHSPILMAFPGAVILSFDTPPIQAVQYDELEHVTLTKSFLADPEAFLRRL
jgi:predicted ATPase